MRYLVSWDFRPVPPQMAEMALALNKATGPWLEAEKKAGGIIEVWSRTDTSGGIAIVEADSNDALYKKIAETPYYPFMIVTVTPLTDIKVALEVGRNFLKKMAGK